MKTIGAFGSGAEQIAELLTSFQMTCQSISASDISRAENCPDVLVVWIANIDSAHVLLKALRNQNYRGRIIVISKIVLTEDDVIALLKAGADHLISAESSDDLLYATVYAASRYHEERLLEVYTVGNLTLNTSTRQTIIGDQVIKLAPAVYELLLHFVKNKGKALSRDDIMKRLRPHSRISKQLINVMVSKIRKAFTQYGCQGVRLTLIRKHGYRLDVD